MMTWVRRIAAAVLVVYLAWGGIGFVDRGQIWRALSLLPAIGSHSVGTTVLRKDATRRAKKDPSSTVAGSSATIRDHPLPVPRFTCFTRSAA
jgi:hypothetical protein